MKRVEIVWRDSMGLGRWRSKNEAAVTVKEDAYLDCISTGYLLSDEPDRVSIVQSATADEESVCDVMTIPREAIKSITPLRSPKER